MSLTLILSFHHFFFLSLFFSHITFCIFPSFSFLIITSQQLVSNKYHRIHFLFAGCAERATKLFFSLSPCTVIFSLETWSLAWGFTQRIQLCKKVESENEQYLNLLQIVNRMCSASLESINGRACLLALIFQFRCI